MRAAGSAGWNLRDGFFLLLLTAGSFLLHGYHPFTEDAAFFVPPAERALDPALFPRDADFFESHGSLTLFPKLIAASVRMTHLSLETVLLVWHLLCVFLFLMGCWRVMRACFAAPEARWAGVGLIAALLTLPAGATTLLLMDPYLNPRSFSTWAGILAVALALEKRYAASLLLLAAACLMHPMMPLYTGFLVFLIWWGRRERHAGAVAALLPFGISLEPPTPAYHQAALLHSFHYVQSWTWYQWLGVWIPLALFLWFGKIARARQMANVLSLCRSLVILILCSLAAALVLDLPARFEALARLQPMRSLHLTFLLFFLLLGGMLGQFVLQRKVWRWLALFLPLCVGAGCLQLAKYPASAHVEWPGAPSENGWVQAFVWIRGHTPQSAYFALDPNYQGLPGEDWQAFRPIAERSMLADRLKDSGAVSMFPGLAEKWWEQVQARKKWNEFQAGDFRRLGAQYGVNWVVLAQPGVSGLDCAYQNSSVLVCRVQ